MKDLVIFDLDGTLADDAHRKHYLDESPRNWDAYFEACDKDTVVTGMAAVFWMEKRWMSMKADWYDCSHRSVQIWTGRNESVRGKTEKWLEDYLYIRPSLAADMLRMRPVQNRLTNLELKRSWYEEATADNKARGGAGVRGQRQGSRVLAAAAECAVLAAEARKLLKGVASAKRLC